MEFKNDITHTIKIKTIVPKTKIPGFTQVVQLNESGTSYIIIDSIPEELRKIDEVDFHKMFNLHPENKHKVIMREKETEVFRYSKSYGNTPNDLSHIEKKSYMYSGFDTSKNNDELPDLFSPIFSYMKQLDVNYNQIVVNWYDENDFIASHSDCTMEMHQNCKISIVSLYPHDDEKNFRFLDVRAKKSSGVVTLASLFRIRLDHGTIITMCGDCQHEFTHGVRKQKSSGRRISLSFRQMCEK